MLQLDVTPMSWPVGMGTDFEGIYDLHANSLSQPEGPSREFHGKATSFTGMDDPALAATLTPAGLKTLRDEAELRSAAMAASMSRRIAQATRRRSISARR